MTTSTKELLKIVACDVLACMVGITCGYVFVLTICTLFDELEYRSYMRLTMALQNIGKDAEE